jgi:hypothetical protein
MSESLRAAYRAVQPTSEVVTGLRYGLLIGMAALVLCVPPHPFGRVRTMAAPANVPISALVGAARTPGTPDPELDAIPATPQQADFSVVSPSREARRLADWVAASGDNRGAPFVVLDKRGARVYVFDADARLTGSTLVLLGSAPGDDSAPGIGSRTSLSQIHSDERTTPAGRFISVPGHDDTGEDVIWVDYDNSVAMHRVKVVDPKERRFERIATDRVDDKRVSNGCINVPIAFYDQFISPTLGRRKAIVYILPEVRPLQEVFPALASRPLD